MASTSTGGRLAEAFQASRLSRALRVREGFHELTALIDDETSRGPRTFVCGITALKTLRVEYMYMTLEPGTRKFRVYVRVIFDGIHRGEWSGH